MKNTKDLIEIFRAADLAVMEIIESELLEIKEVQAIAINQAAISLAQVARTNIKTREFLRVHKFPSEMQQVVNAILGNLNRLSSSSAEDMGDTLLIPFYFNRMDGTLWNFLAEKIELEV